MYLMTLLALLCHVAHTMLDIMLTTVGCIHDRTGFLTHILTHSFLQSVASQQVLWAFFKSVFTFYTSTLSWNLLCNFSVYFLALRQIPPASVFHKFMPSKRQSFRGGECEILFQSTISFFEHLCRTRGHANVIHIHQTP